jgi:hypothetical protein
VETVDLSRQLHLSVVDVRGAFAAEGIRLSQGPDGGDSITTLGLGRLPWDATDLTVTVLPEKGVIGLGHGDWEEHEFSQRVGNVLVQYGGSDKQLLERIEDATARLRPVVGPRGAFAD